MIGPQGTFIPTGRKHRSRTGLLIVATISFAFFLFQSFAPVSLNNLLVLPLTVSAPAPAETAVVHGSGLGPRGEIRVYAAERLDCALEAYKHGLVHHVILSGGTRKAGFVEAVAMRDYLLRCGVDSAALLTEPDSRNTWGNAIFSERILAAHHWGTPLVITSPFHTLRTRLVWQHVLHTEDVPVSTPAHSFVTDHVFKDRWGGLYTLLREYAALAKYWVEGRLGK